MFSFLVVATCVIGLTYGLLRHIHYTWQIVKNRQKPGVNRIVVGNILTSVSFAGFLMAFILNILVGFQVIQPTIITSNSTALSCFFFLFVFLISKFKITPQHSKQNKLMV